MAATPADPVAAVHGEAVRRARFTGDAADVREARQFVQDAIAVLGPGGPRQEAVLAASELVSNAIRHAATPFDVRVRLDPSRLRVEIEDGSPVIPEERAPTSAEPTGRGLQIVRQCSHRWGATPLGDRGKVVWFEIDRVPPPAEGAVPPAGGQAAATPWAETGERSARRTATGPAPTATPTAAPLAPAASMAPAAGPPGATVGVAAGTSTAAGGDGLDTLAEVGARLVSERDVDTLVQLVADQATAAVDAAFGAFFTGEVDQGGEPYLAYTLAGGEPDARADLPLPGPGSLPGRAVTGGPLVRLDDVQAERSAELPPPVPLPAGHPPVRSYLGVPVVSPTGTVHGGLLLGHPEAGRFDARAERLAAGIARFAGVALDNARALDGARSDAHSASEIAAWLRTVVDASPVGMAIHDRGLRWVMVNDAMAAMNGLSAEDHIGRHPGEALPELSTEAVGAMQQVLDTGRPVVGLEVEGRTPARPSATRSWLVSYFPIADGAGAVAWVGVVAVDITERREAEEERHRLTAQASEAGAAAARVQAQLELLAEVGRWGSSPVAVDELLHGVGRLIVPAFADVAVVSQLDEGTVGRRVLAAEPEELRQAAAALAGQRIGAPDGPERGDRPGEATPAAVPPAALVLRTGRGQAVPALADELGGDGAGIRSLVVVPTTLRHQVIGVLALGSRTPGAFTDEDVPFWEEVGRRLGAALDTAENRVRQTRIVHTLQTALLPPGPPRLAGLSVTARYQPAAHDQFGGDWWDAFEVPDGLVVTVGDVVGHDLEAAAAMGHLRLAARAYATEHRDLATVLDRLSDFAARDPATDLATAVLALVEPTTGLVRWWRAGHPPPLLVRGRTVEVLDVPLCPPLGLPTRPATGEARLRPGDTLVLYTDGLYEQRGQTLAARLDELTRRAAGLRHAPLDELCDGLLAAMVTPHAQADDVALVAVRRHQLPSAAPAAGPAPPSSPAPPPP